jgi:hypothetical protein
MHYTTIMSDNRYIDGIFNYCDYWCERCAFTQRCRNDAMGRELEQQAHGEPPPDDATQADFWNTLAEELRTTQIFGKPGDWDHTNDTDIFLDDYMPDTEYEEQAEKQRRAVDAHPLTKLAEVYRKKVAAWLKSSDSDLKAVATELKKSAESPFDKTDYEEQALQIGETLDVITWYHTLLYPKTARAISGILSTDKDRSSGNEFDEIIMESHLRDANGCGKLVLVSIQRSAAAWLRIREIMPHREDEILEMLSILSQLRRGIHSSIPGAKTFIRPGLDQKQP